jgi:toxin ParE1/3/4
VKYIFIDEAQSEFDDAFDYYEALSTNRGSDLIHDFDQTINRILEFPESGSKLSRRTRKAVLKKYPYNIIYLIHESVIYIVSFMHQKRDPDYWTDRIF